MRSNSRIYTVLEIIHFINGTENKIFVKLGHTILTTIEDNAHLWRTFTLSPLLHLWPLSKASHMIWGEVRGCHQAEIILRKSNSNTSRYMLELNGTWKCFCGWSPVYYRKGDQCYLYMVSRRDSKWLCIIIWPSVLTSWRIITG